MRILSLLVIALVAAALTGCALESAGAPQPTDVPTATLDPNTPPPLTNIPPVSPLPREDSFALSSPTPAPTHTISVRLDEEPEAANRNPTTTPGAKPTPFLEETTTEALAQPVSPRVKPGIEVLVEDQRQLVEGKRIGLITNQTGIGPDGRSDVEWLSSIPGARVVALFAGEHGLLGTEEAGKKLSGGVDPNTGIRVYSLYGETLRPKPEWLRDVDVLIFDIQNSGSSLYTYKFTMSFGMEAAARAGIPFLVLDRPNPAGGTHVEGPMLPAHDIWRYPLPARHGMTNGELAAMWNEEYRLGAKLTVVKMEGWSREMTWEETGLPWVRPSPNIPAADTCLAYTGQALIESVSNVSEGRGTPNPFLVTGAPWVNGAQAAAQLNALALPGATFRPVTFTPRKAGEKYNGQKCQGVEIVFTDRRAYQAVLTTLSILDAYGRSASRSISGGGIAIAGLRSGRGVAQLVQSYQVGIKDFLALRQKYLLY